MRVDYHKAFPGGMRAMAELERAVHSAARERAALARCEALAELPRTGAPLRSDVLGLDGLDLPDGAGPQPASGRA